MFASSSLGKVLDALLRYGTAYLLLVLMFMLSVVTIPFLPVGAFKISFFLIALYYWSVYRPRFILPWLAFASGFLIDVLAGFPLGLNAFLYVAVQAVIISQRRLLTVQNFFIIWAGFAVVMVLVSLAQWIVMGMFIGKNVSIYSLSLEAGMSILMYPVVALILSVPHKFLPDTHASHMFKA